jgi:hypothetical protein
MRRVDAARPAAREIFLERLGLADAVEGIAPALANPLVDSSEDPAILQLPEQMASQASSVKTRRLAAFPAAAPPLRVLALDVAFGARFLHAEGRHALSEKIRISAQP